MALPYSGSAALPWYDSQPKPLLRDAVRAMSGEADQILDASGLQCPMPLLKTKLCLNGMEPGQSLRVIATDPGSARDIPAFLRLSNHELEVEEHDDDRYVFVIRRGDDRAGSGHG